MEYSRLGAVLKDTDYFLQAIDILVPGSPSLGHPPGEYLLGEDIEIEGDLYVEIKDMKGCHIGNHHLPWSVNGVPCGIDQVRILVLHLPGSVMDLMPRL